MPGAQLAAGPVDILPQRPPDRRRQPPPFQGRQKPVYLFFGGTLKAPPPRIVIGDQVDMTGKGLQALFQRRQILRPVVPVFL